MMLTARPPSCLNCSGPALMRAAPAIPARIPGSTHLRALVAVPASRSIRSKSGMRTSKRACSMTSVFEVIPRILDEAIISYHHPPIRPPRPHVPLFYLSGYTCSPQIRTRRSSGRRQHISLSLGEGFWYDPMATCTGPDLLSPCSAICAMLVINPELCKNPCRRRMSPT